jgi:hypothetical protein
MRQFHRLPVPHLVNQELNINNLYICSSLTILAPYMGFLISGECRWSLGEGAILDLTQQRPRLVRPIIAGQSTNQPRRGQTLNEDRS